MKVPGECLQLAERVAGTKGWFLELRVSDALLRVGTPDAYRTLSALRVVRPTGSPVLAIIHDDDTNDAARRVLERIGTPA